MESLAEKRARVRQVIAALRKAHPDARLALNFATPLELMIALILAARARDDLVNGVTAELFKQYRTAADWANARPEQLHAQLRTINFYRNKTRAIQNACRVLVDRFGGQVPDKLEDLLTLPGVGRKTANIILGNAFGQPAIGVDTHVGRLAQRLGFTRKTDPDDIEADLVQIVPPKDAVKFCHLLQFHGRRVCQAQRPNCPQCVVRKLCPFPKKTKA
jgi:endonuclease-3